MLGKWSASLTAASSADRDEINRYQISAHPWSAAAGWIRKNSIRITAIEEKYTFIANGVEIDNFEDGFLLGTGQIEIVIFNVRNLKLYIDNLVILEPE